MKIKKDFIQLTILLSAAVVLIAFSADAKNGAADGLKMAGEIVVPSLLPLLIIFNLISNAGTKRLVEAALAPVTEKVFRLPRSAAGAILFGLIGGYPTGALLTENLFINEDIDSKTARRLLRFNVNGGAAFIITATGTSILKSEKAGFLLFASTTLSAVLIAFFSAFSYPKIKYESPAYSCLPLGEALNKSTESAVHAVLNIAAYITLFCAIKNIIAIPPPLVPVFEITSGVAQHCSIFTLPQLAGLLAFGGFCIHFQLFSVIKNISMHYFDFFLWRIVHAVSSYGVCSLLLKIFPAETAVFSNFSNTMAEPVSISATLSVLMIISCGVIVLDIESKKRKI